MLLHMLKCSGFIGSKRFLAHASCGLVFFFAVSCQASMSLSNNWNGTWKLDPAKSHVYGPTLRISRSPDGVFHNSGRIGSANFDCDGKEHRVSESLTISCTQRNSDYLEILGFKNGSKVSTAHWKLSNNENSLTIQGTMFQPDGSAKSKEAHYIRTSGLTGFVGGWRNVEPFKGLPSILQTSIRNNALHLSYPESGTHVDALIDGASAAVHTPMFPSGATIVLSERGPQVLILTTELKGQAVYIEDWQISANGRSLTQSSWFESKPNEKYVLVYVKQ